MPDSPDPVNAELWQDWQLKWDAEHARAEAAESALKLAEELRIEEMQTAVEALQRADRAEAALLLCQQDKDEAIREWRLSQQTETILHGRAEASASALQQMTQERDEAIVSAEAAVKWIGCVTEELVMAGGQGGDRTVALANLRALIRRADASASALSALQQGVEKVIEQIADTYTFDANVGHYVSINEATQWADTLSTLLSSSISAKEEKD